MNPSDYFKEGSEGYVQTKQAIDVINAAKAAGLPEAEQYQKDLESSISLARKSGWRDFSGFDATRKAVSGLMPRVEAMSQAEGSVQNITSGIDASIGLIRSSGGNVSEETIKAIDQAKASRNPAALKALHENIGKTAQEVFKQTAMPPTAKESADAAIAKKAREDEKIAAVDDLKNQYKNIISIKEHPQIRQAFGMPIGITSTGYPGGTVSSRLIPGTGASEASAGVNQLANQAWVNKIIAAKNAGLTLGSVDKIEGAKLALAATKLAEPQNLTYETGNKELQAMAESVKKLYTKATGRNIAEDVIAESKPSSEKQVVDDAKTADDFLKSF